MKFFELHHFHHPDRETAERLRRIENRLGLIHERQEIIMATMEELQASVKRNTDVDDSVVLLLEGISQQLKDAQASGNPQAIADIITKLDANTQKMADAVTANTPAA